MKINISLLDVGEGILYDWTIMTKFFHALLGPYWYTDSDPVIPLTHDLFDVLSDGTELLQVVCHRSIERSTDPPPAINIDPTASLQRHRPTPRPSQLEHPSKAHQLDGVTATTHLPLTPSPHARSATTSATTTATTLPSHHPHRTFSLHTHLPYQAPHTYCTSRQLHIQVLQPPHSRQ